MYVSHIVFISWTCKLTQSGFVTDVSNHSPCELIKFKFKPVNPETHSRQEIEWVFKPVLKLIFKPVLKLVFKPVLFGYKFTKKANEALFH